MKNLKSKLIGLAGGAGVLCALCCSLPILGLIGLGSIEAYFCENETLKWAGILLAGGAFIYFLSRRMSRVSSCSINCGCKA